MSAAVLTKRLLSLHYDEDEDEFLQCLIAILKQFISTKNPIFPRQDVIECLVKSVTHSTCSLLVKLALTTLTEFCNTSVTYDADFVKKELIRFRMVAVLCTLLSSQSLSKDIELSELCLALICKLSDYLLPVESQLVLSDILPLCISMCNTKRQFLFEYTPNFKRKLKEMMINRGLVMRVYEYNTGTSKSKCELFSQLFGSKQLQFSLCVGDVFDTSSELDKNVCSEMVDQGLAWFSSEVTDTYDNGNAQDNYIDIIPSELIDGPYFLAHELDKLKQISDIENIMQEKVHMPLASAPSTAQLVTVYGPLSSPHRVTLGTQDIFYRAQVCCKIEGTSYLVVSLDYGQMKEINQSQLFHPCQALAHILPSVTLCSINGLKPSPLSVQLLTTGLSILHTLSLGNFTISDRMVNHWSAVDVLIDLACVSPYEHISSQAMGVLANTSQCGRVRTDGVVKYDAVSRTIMLIKYFAEKGWRKAMMSACNALSLMVVDNVDASSQFAEGVGKLVTLIAKHQSDVEVKACLLQSIRNYLGSVHFSQNLASFAPTEKTSNVTTPVVSPDNTSQGDELTSKPVTPTSTPIAGRYGRMAGAKHRQINLHELDEQNSGNDISMLRLARKQYYVNGAKTSLIASDSCSTFESENAMDCRLFQTLLLGFLNSGVSGSVIYGVTSDGVVRGINIGRSCRDHLRLGIDRVCSDFNPPLIANVPSLHFIPICLREGADDPALRMFIPDTFIVEIAVNASAMINQVYKLKNDERLLMRVGTETREVCVQVLRELIIKRMEQNMELGL